MRRKLSKSLHEVAAAANTWKNSAEDNEAVNASITDHGHEGIPKLSAPPYRLIPSNT